MTPALTNSSAPTVARFLSDPRTLLACGAAGGPLFLAVGLVLGLADDSFSFGRNALSQLSLGDSGWIHRGVFLVTGALMCAGAAGIRQVLLGAGAGFLALCAAFVILARHFAATGQRGWALACRIVPAGVLAGFAASSASVVAFSAGAALGLCGLTAVAVHLRRTI